MCLHHKEVDYLQQTKTRTLVLITLKTLLRFFIWVSCLWEKSDPLKTFRPVFKFDTHNLLTNNFQLLTSAWHVIVTAHCFDRSKHFYHVFCNNAYQVNTEEHRSVRVLLVVRRDNPFRQQLQGP